MKKPLFSEEAINYVDAYLNKNHIIFEYGSGYSTLYLSTLCSRIVSMEHNDVWFERIQKEIESNHCDNIDLYLIYPDKIQDNSFFSHRLGKSFKTYVTKILEYPNSYFDLIIIDGRARPSCLENSLLKVKINGLILFDDTSRDVYQKSFELLSDFEPVVMVKDGIRDTRIYKKIKSNENSF